MIRRQEKIYIVKRVITISGGALDTKWSPINKRNAQTKKYKSNENKKGTNNNHNKRKIGPDK